MAARGSVAAEFPGLAGAVVDEGPDPLLHVRVKARVGQRLAQLGALDRVLLSVQFHAGSRRSGVDAEQGIGHRGHLEAQTLVLAAVRGGVDQLGDLLEQWCRTPPRPRGCSAGRGSAQLT
ncbi:hypothetical protein [Nocardia abscessus]|uniref:hypothetical protein n=1 Tax=Nocardia abscessus TaxID=120957 RepID=UPI0024543091|nr:hypothetical protein [Nocardia abscessus]